MTRSRMRDISKFLALTAKSNTNNRRIRNTNTISTQLDSATTSSIAGTGGISKLASADSLPTTSLTAGQMSLIESSGGARLYLTNGVGWFNVATINESPTLILDQSGTIALSAESLSITVNARATDLDTDSDLISFSVESDGNMVGTGTTVSQDSSVFTISALSAESGGVAGNFTLTFKASDQINVDNEALAFSLAFVNNVDSSAETYALVKATGNGVHNSAITYLHASDASSNFTEANNPTASTFSPYRSGGYSYFNNGTNTVWLEFADNTDFQMTITDDWSIECWVHLNETGVNNYILSQGTSPRTSAFGITTSNTLGFQVYDGSNRILYYSTGTISQGEWTHVALTHETTGASTGTLRYYINGVLDGSFSVSGGWSWYNGTAFATGWNVGRYVYSNIAHFDGYIRDLRVLKGTRAYTSAFTPPTETLTAVTNTVLLTCQGPFIADRSSTPAAVTHNGLPELHPFGPYDYEAWTANKVGGSVYLGNAASVYANDTGLVIGTSEFTYEGWYYRNKSNSNGDMVVLFEGRSGSGNASTGIYFKLEDNGGAAAGNYSTSATTGSVYANGNNYHGQWSHFVLQRTSTHFELYHNGTRVAQTTTGLSTNISNDYIRIGTNYVNGGGHEGYVADVKLTVGSSKYSGATITLPTSPVSHDGTGTKLLMQNKTDANVYDLSGSTAVIGELNASAGNILSSTSQRQFSTSSSLDFTSGSGGARSLKLVQENFDPRAFVSGPFTVEFWVYPNGAWSSSQSLFTIGWKSGAGNYGAILFYSNNPIVMYSSNNGSSWNALSNVSTGISHWTGSWKHIAFCKYSNGDYGVYLDGVPKAYGSSGVLDNLEGNSLFTNASADMSFCLNGNPTQAGHAVDGYFQDLRLSSVAKYPQATFTPPAAEFDL